MGKLQEIKKPNDRVIYMCYPPVTTIEELGWSKGDELVYTVENDKIIIERV